MPWNLEYIGFSGSAMLLALSVFMCYPNRVYTGHLYFIIDLLLAYCIGSSCVKFVDILESLHQPRGVLVLAQYFLSRKLHVYSYIPVKHYNCIESATVKKQTHNHNRAQIRVRKCGIPAVFTQIPRISYHKCEIFPHHLLDSVGTASVWCNRVLVYLDTKSTAELS